MVHLLLKELLHFDDHNLRRLVLSVRHRKALTVRYAVHVIAPHDCLTKAKFIVNKGVLAKKKKKKKVLGVPNTQVLRIHLVQVAACGYLPQQY